MLMKIGSLNIFDRERLCNSLKMDGSGTEELPFVRLRHVPKGWFIIYVPLACSELKNIEVY